MFLRPSTASMLLAVALSAPSTALAAPAAPTAARSAPSASSASIHRQVDALFASHAGPGTPGCATAIARDGKLDYERGYGSANLEMASPITPATPFHAASIAKQFTAFAVLLLQQEGKLSLDDDIHRHVPELPDYGVPVTLRHLMHHTSGMREQGQLLHLAGWRAGDVVNHADLISVIRRQRTLNHAPGTEPLYTNAAYTLLAEVVARRSGMPLREFARTRIFGPLGMRDTFFRDDHTEPVPGRAIGYNPAAAPGAGAGVAGGWRIAVPHADHAGSSSLSTTVRDLLVWQRNLLDGRVGGGEVARLMRTSGALESGVEHGYGGGLRIERYRGLRTVGHDGVDGGYRADAVLFPDQRLSVVVLCNAGTVQASTISRRIADLYLAEAMTPPQPARVALPQEQAGRLAGMYWSPTTDELVRIDLVDGGLRPRLRQELLHHLGGGAFQLGDGLERWRFDAADGRLRIWDAWPTPRVFERVTEGSAPLAAYAGAYRSADLDTRYEARVQDGTLVLHYGRNVRTVLEPASGDRFFSPTLGTVTFTRTANGAIDGLTISSRRLRRFAAQRVDGAP